MRIWSASVPISRFTMWLSVVSPNLGHERCETCCAMRTRALRSGSTSVRTRAPRRGSAKSRPISMQSRSPTVRAVASRIASSSRTSRRTGTTRRCGTNAYATGSRYARRTDGASCSRLMCERASISRTTITRNRRSRTVSAVGSMTTAASCSTIVTTCGWPMRTPARRRCSRRAPGGARTSSTVPCSPTRTRSRLQSANQFCFHSSTSARSQVALPALLLPEACR